MFNPDKNMLQPNGAYKTNLMSEEQRAVCSDQPSGILLSDGVKEDTAVPPGIIIVNNFLDTDTCKTIVNYAGQQPGSRLQVMYRNPVTGEAESKPDEGRITEYVNIQGIYEQLSSTLENACRSILEPHFKIDIEWYEKPSMLRYGPGGKYEHHADSENWNSNTQTWSRFCDRAYSLLLYLNDDFSGGSLYYQNFDFSLKPKAGMLVAFPSDHRYVHKAEPVLTGTRYAIVSWVVVKERRDFTKGKPVPPHAVLMP